MPQTAIFPASDAEPANAVRENRQYLKKFTGFVLFALLAVLFVSVYTVVLQKMTNESMLENAVAENNARTDAMHRGVSNFLTREDFTEINVRSDLSTERYRRLQKRLNDIRNMNSTRYFYTAKRGPEGRPIYLVDGLDLGADDFAFPGTFIEEEVVPFISEALNGKTVYSQNIIDTTWGHIFTAAYPVRANDGTGDVIGALCIEMDMEPVHRFIEKRNRIAFYCALLGAVIVVLLIGAAAARLHRQRQIDRDRQQLLEEAAEAASSANRAKSTFLFNMSHDIRTPMNAIIGYAELAQKHLTEPEKLAGYMANIQTCGQKLLALLNNVLDLARIENNKTVLEETPTQIEDDFRFCLSLFTSETEAKAQTLTSDVSLVSPYVYLDEVHFAEIMMNLLSNATKYTGRGGAVHCTLTQTPLKDGWCTIQVTVADTGIGMSDEFQRHIFEAFSRERTSTVSGIEGSGLGMGIVKRLVALMQGTIAVSSTLGKGSTFTMSLPCRLATENDVTARKADQTLPVGDLSGRRVLLAEDNDLNAEIATELLSEAGLTVERAADGVACVEMLEKAPAGYYDVILMDIQMPIMDGYTAAQKIRRLHDAAKASVPIIATTANAFTEDCRRALEVGMNDHVAKPIDMNVLLPTIERHLKPKLSADPAK